VSNFFALEIATSETLGMTGVFGPEQTNQQEKHDHY